ncbi:ABC transporter substrate-binding protein [Jiangella asiatica]|uniref:Extracellular solute-binding protein n=1 Tax=Jiangella asiatica TaxID=2530372 RepID=A0A4R5DHI8_9ACTN|nr:extracellular solute-binding protein [Jiangella asiatica]TDE13542.1 extracellular solute-binding protein [Jiangella asiatica]
MNGRSALGPTMSRRRFLEVGGLGLATVAGGSLLSGCGGDSGSASGDKTLTVIVSQSPTAPEGQQRILDLITQKFEDANPGATVRFDVVQLGSAVATAIMTTAASHDGPDIFEVGPQHLPTGQAAGVFEPITDAEWDGLGGRDRYLPSVLAAMGQSDDAQVAVPYYASTMAMYYNTAHFAEAGLTAPPTTWSDFIAVAQQLSDPAAEKYAVGEAAAEPTHPWHVIWLLTKQLGADLISADGTTAQLDADEVLEATRFWMDWIAEHRIVARRGATQTSAEQVQQFVNAEISMFPCGFTQAISSMPGTAVADTWGLAGNPTVPFGMSALPAGQPAVQTYLGGATWAISKHSKNRDLALELTKLMGDPDVQQLTWQEVGGLPVTEETFEAHPETREDHWQVIYDAAVAAEATPWSPSFGQVSPLIAEALKPSFAELAGSGGYDSDALRTQLQTANEKLAAALATEARQ